jgi:hypothetical protein
MSRIAARSGKAPAEKPAPVTVTLDFGDGDVVDVVVDTATLTFAEMHEVRTVLARLTVRDDQGRVILEPDVDTRVLAHAWVVLRRSRPMSWDELFGGLSARDGLSVAAAEEDDSPEA